MEYRLEKGPADKPKEICPFSILTLSMLANFACLMSSVDFSIFFRNTVRVLNGSDPDQVPHYDGPDLVPNSFQRLPADDKSLVYSCLSFLL